MNKLFKKVQNATQATTEVVLIHVKTTEQPEFAGTLCPKRMHTHGSMYEVFVDM
jgi:hypothetical protein